MAAPLGKVPILKSARAGLNFVGGRWRALAPIALGGAGAVMAAGALTSPLQHSPALVMLSFLLQALILGVVYAGYLGVALREPEAQRGRFFPDAVRVIPAMAIVGFFLALVMFIVLMPGGVILSVAIAPFANELNAAAGDPIATSAVLERAMAAQPAPFFTLAALYVAIWLAMSSRLYLAAPATVAEEQVRTFETWPWTKGAMLRIAAARLVLLAPFSIPLWIAQQSLLRWAQSFGANEPPFYAGFAVLTFILASLVVLALEAGLSAYLYRGLRPKPA